MVQTTMGGVKIMDRQLLDKGQMMRLYGVLEEGIKAPLTEVEYLGEGEFKRFGYQTEFTLTLSEKDTYWIMQGIIISREN